MLSILIFFIPSVFAWSIGDSDVGRLPALGWNSWNHFECDINQDKIRAAAKQTIKLGLKDAGYVFINIDDCWAEQNRTEKKTLDGRSQWVLTNHKQKFPDGIKKLADEIHDMGLKLGIYSDAGSQTCQRTMPGSLGFEEIDAQTWAEWGVDYLKYDNCNIPGDWIDKCDFCKEPNGTCSSNPRTCPPTFDYSKTKSAERYTKMRDALKKQSRPIFYSLCNGGAANVQQWGPATGMSWRATDDIQNNWNSVVDILCRNAFSMNNIDFFSHSDADMLEIGNGGLNNEQERTHFALWAAMKSPLLIGADLTKIKDSSLSILKTKPILEFHQDSKYGKAAQPFKWNWTYDTQNPPQYWAGQYSGGTMIWLFNKNSKKTTMQVKLGDIPHLPKAKTYLALNGWTGEKYRCITSDTVVGYQDIAPFDTMVFVLQPDACKIEKAHLVDLQAPMQV